MFGRGSGSTHKHAASMCAITAPNKGATGGYLFVCQGLGFRVWGLGFGVWGLGFRVLGLGFRAPLADICAFTSNISHTKREREL